MPPPPAGPEQGADAFLQEAPAYSPPPSLLSAVRESLRRSIETIKTQSLDKEAYSRALVQLDLLEGFEAGNTFQNESAIGLNGPNVDAEWVERVEEEGRREAGKLDVELKGYMSNLIKESIRVSHLLFANLLLTDVEAACVMTWLDDTVDIPRSCAIILQDGLTARRSEELFICPRT